MSIQDVADSAGVSVTTVSHALNGKGRLDPATRERVRATADALGYTPNRAAQSLVTGRTFTIGLSMPDPAGLAGLELLYSDWYGQVIVSASRRAQQRQYAVSILPTFESVRELRRYPADGVIVLEAEREDRRLALLARAGIPHVSTDCDPTRPKVLHVRPDADAGMNALLGHLKERGAKRVLLIAPRVDLQYYENAFTAADTWGSADFKVERTILDNDRSFGEGKLYEDVRTTTTRALGRRNRPDAIVGMYEGFGTNIIIAATAAGFSVPDDVFVAQDIDGPSTRVAPPGITALDQHAEQQADSAVDLLLAHIEGAPGLQSRVTAVTLRVRASTGGE